MNGADLMIPATIGSNNHKELLFMSSSWRLIMNQAEVIND